jgi:hypothetical protein
MGPQHIQIKAISSTSNFDQFSKLYARKSKVREIFAQNSTNLSDNALEHIAHTTY